MLVAIAGILGAVRLLNAEEPAAGCTAPVGQLRVGAAPAVVPWLGELAASYTAGRPTVAGRCVVVQVRPLSPDQARKALLPGAADVPDVWVPESTTALALLRAAPGGTVLIGETPPPIAVSPLVLAAPPEAMQRLRGTGADVQLADLVPRLADPRGWGQPGLDRPDWGVLRLSTTDPGRTALGASVLSALAGAVTETPSVDVSAMTYLSTSAQEGLLGVSRAFGSTPVEPADLLTTVAKATTAAKVVTSVGVLAVYEQDVWRHDTAGPAIPLDAAYPLDGQLAADFPYVVPQAPWVDAGERAAAADFLAWVLGADAQGRLDRYGLRRADGVAGPGIAAGLRAESTPPMAPLPPTVLGGPPAAQRAWQVLTRPVSLLALMDVSGSMAEPVPGSAKSKLDLARDASQAAFSYIDGRDSVGLWEFSRQLDGDRDHRVLVPLGPAGRPVGRFPNRLSAATAAYRGMVPRTATGLYDTVLAAYRSASATYRPDAVNTVVVISDGANEDAGSITLERLLVELRRLYDPARPVYVVTLAYGADADQDVLQRIANATDGLRFAAPDPRTIGTVFTRALLALTTR